MGPEIITDKSARRQEMCVACRSSPDATDLESECLPPLIEASCSACTAPIAERRGRKGKEKTGIPWLVARAPWTVKRCGQGPRISSLVARISRRTDPVKRGTCGSLKRAAFGDDRLVCRADCGELPMRRSIPIPVAIGMRLPHLASRANASTLLCFYRSTARLRPRGNAARRPRD